MTADEVFKTVYATLVAVYVAWFVFMLVARWYVYRRITIHDVSELLSWPIGLPLHVVLAAKRQREEWLLAEADLQQARENPNGYEPGDDVDDIDD